MFLFYVVFLMWLIMAYLTGSLLFAVIICRLLKLPYPRTVGSKNAGATNAARMGGKKLAAAVFIGDFLKGFSIVMISRYFLPDFFWGWIGLFSVIGHIFPVYFNFRGGKGVSTAAGVLMGLSGMLGGVVIASWIIIALLLLSVFH